MSPVLSLAQQVPEDHAVDAEHEHRLAECDNKVFQYAEWFRLELLPFEDQSGHQVDGQVEFKGQFENHDETPYTLLLASPVMDVLAVDEASIENVLFQLFAK